jgi:hypothetical protein
VDETPLEENVPYLEHRGLHLAGSLVWVEVGPGRPCPRCGAVQGCAVSEDGRFAWCRLVVSAHPVDGAGWLHPLPGGAPGPG